jgi:hypothetical protein
VTAVHLLLGDPEVERYLAQHDLLEGFVELDAVRRSGPTRGDRA